jgi:hypothetical protein
MSGILSYWARRTQCLANVLAFSCEAARVISQCSQDMARLRQLQPRVRWQATGTQYDGYQGAVIVGRDHC